MNKIGTTSVMTASGLIEVPMWAEFRYEIADRNVLFRVTSPILREGGRRIDGKFEFVVTHVGSGHIMTRFGFKHLASHRYHEKRNNYGAAGAAAVTAVIAKHGRARIAKAIEEYPDD